MRKFYHKPIIFSINLWANKYKITLPFFLWKVFVRGILDTNILYAEDIVDIPVSPHKYHSRNHCENK